MTENDVRLYVLDTHALYWYWNQPDRLGRQASAAFQAQEKKQAIGLVPVIVVAELHYLTSKLQRPLSIDQLLLLIDRAPSLRLEGLTRRHLLAFGTLSDVPEMHDRLIGAVALVHGAPVVSRDGALRDHPRLKTLW